MRWSCVTACRGCGSCDDGRGASLAGACGGAGDPRPVLGGVRGGGPDAERLPADAGLAVVSVVSPPPRCCSPSPSSAVPGRTQAGSNATCGRTTASTACARSWPRPSRATCAGSSRRWIRPRWTNRPDRPAQPRTPRPQPPPRGHLRRLATTTTHARDLPLPIAERARLPHHQPRHPHARRTSFADQVWDATASVVAGPRAQGGRPHDPRVHPAVRCRPRVESTTRRGVWECPGSMEMRLAARPRRP